MKLVNEMKELQAADWVSLLEKIVHAEVGGCRVVVAGGYTLLAQLESLMVWAFR